MDDISGLKIKGIITYRELSALEMESILVAKGKYFTTNVRRFDISERSIKKIHHDMFGKVWEWAGVYRKTQTNIGMKPYRIGTEIFKLVEDMKYWEQIQMPFLEIAAYLHHRLAFIHSFENGNGRHARFFSDLYLHFNRHPFPQWPIELTDESQSREKYIQALKEGDRGDISSLISYMESYLG